jgi:hypothetical protein
MILKFDLKIIFILNTLYTYTLTHIKYDVVHVDIATDQKYFKTQSLYCHSEVEDWMGNPSHCRVLLKDMNWWLCPEGNKKGTVISIMKLKDIMK